MWIKSKSTNDKRSWQSCSLFDTDTGIRYRLMFLENETDPYMSPVRLNIEAANTPGGEYTGGISYTGLEAINFWLELAKYLPLSIDTNKWSIQAANDARVVFLKWQDLAEQDALLTEAPGDR